MDPNIGSNPVHGFEIRDFGGFGWVHSLVLVDDSGFRMVRSSVFPDLGLGSAHFWPKRFEIQAFWRGYNGFKVQFWWRNLGSREFEVQLVKFEAV